MYRNVTMINDLPDLDELERRNQNFGPQNNYDHHGFSNQQGMPEERLQKYIRNPSALSPESGMGGYGEGYGPPQNYNNSHATFNYDSPGQQPQQQAVQQFVPPQLNCLDVAQHIQGCPICSKFYQNDKTVYIIVIVVLSIVCLLLLKRVLNV